VIFRDTTPTDEPEPDDPRPRADAISVIASVGPLIFLPLALGWRVFAWIVAVALVTGVAVEVLNYLSARASAQRQNREGE
jgi:hypothetical protein